MAFRFIKPTADGTFQYVLSRQIEDPDTINLTDTPSDGLTGMWMGNVTGSLQSIEFEKVTEDQLVLATSSGNGTQFLLDGIGANPSVASDLMFETWMKIYNDTYSAGYVMDWFDATVQRNENTSTVGFDGIYSNRLVNVDPDGNSVSAFYVDFQFAKDTNFAYSCTSTSSIPLDTWTHVMTSYTSGDPVSTGEMRIYINGVLDRSVTLSDLETWTPGNTFILPPTTTDPLPYRGLISFAGKLDEMRMWTSSGSAAAIERLASVTSMGLVPEVMDQSVIDVFSPSADYMVGWWRFESVSAFQIFASVPEAIIDSTSYQHHGTAKFFEGATDFSDEQHGIYGGASAFPLLKTGTPDNGGLLVVDNLNTTITVEEGIENIIPAAQNIWGTIGSSTAVIDEKQIWSGTSGVRVQTTQEGDGIIHEINYNPQLFFDKNEYTAHFRLLHTSGSVSALVSFSLGHPDNVTSTTATMEKFAWNPIYIRNTVSADFNDPNNITGFIKVTQLVDGVSVDNGQKYNLDGLYLKEGGYPASFVAPDDIRKSGQIYWEISD